ncbi:hypothetical protein D9M68_644900 [compost metagenome]
MRRGLGTDIQDHVVFGHVGGGLDGCFGIGAERLGANHVNGDRHGRAALLHDVDHGAGLVDLIGFGQRLADGQAGGEHEGIGDAAAHDQLVDLVGQRLQDGQLGRHFGAAHDGDERTLGFVQRAAQGFQLGLQQGAGAGHGREARNAVGGGLGPVGRAEGVIDVDVAQRRHLLGQRFVVLLLADVHAAVFQQHDLAVIDLHAIDPVAHQLHGHAQQLGQALADLGERIGLGQHALLGAAQVGRDHDGGAGVQRHADAGHRGADAGVFADAACVVERHVQVGADEHALAGQGAGLGQRGEGIDLGHV